MLRATAVGIVLLSVLACDEGTGVRSPEETVKRFFTSVPYVAYEMLTEAARQQVTFESFLNYHQRAESFTDTIRLIPGSDPNWMKVSLTDKEGIKALHSLQRSADGSWWVAFDDPLVQEAIELRAEKKHEEAIRRCKQALIINPLNGETHALISILEKSPDEAVKAALKAIELDPDIGSGYLAAGMAFQHKGDRDKAEQYLRAGLQYNKSSFLDMRGVYVGLLAVRDKVAEAKGFIEAEMEKPDSLTPDFVSQVAIIAGGGAMFDIGKKYRETFVRVARRMDPREKCHVDHLLLRVELVSAGEVKDASAAMTAVDRLMPRLAELGQRCPDYSEFATEATQKFRKAQRAIQVRRAQIAAAVAELQTLEGRVKFALRSLPDLTLRRVLRCLADANDGVRAAVGQSASGAYGLAAIRYYNELDIVQKFIAFQRTIWAMARRSGLEQWYVRKKLWQDWCYFSDSMASDVSQIDVSE